MNDRKFKIGQFVYYKPRPSGLGLRRVDHPAIRLHSSCRPWATNPNISHQKRD